MSDALPRYELGEELGRGAWGVVVAAHHRDLDRAVAIKQLPPAFGADPDVRARFRREAQLLASLTHPHIVQIHDFVEHEGMCLLVMERLDGGTLSSRFQGQGLTMEESVAAVLATCEALQRAHDRGVLHRDVKPDNLMFTEGGTLKVTDFGIAKVLGGSQTVATTAGMVLGTPAYMAPEQAAGNELVPATDVYAVAVILYELLSGRLPFALSGDLGAMLRDRAFGTPTPLSVAAPTVPAALAGVVDRGLAPSPTDRFDSALGFGAAVADAANQALGAGWFGRQRLDVMATGPIAASLGTARADAATPAPAPATAAIHPSAVPPPPVEPPVAATPTPGEVVPVSALVDGAAAVPPPPTAPPSGPPPTSSRPRWLWPAAGAVAVVLLVVVALLVLGGGDDGDAAPPPATEETEDTTTTTEPATTTTEVTRPAIPFQQAMDDSGTLVAELPESWTDQNGAPTSSGADLQASTDIGDFLDPDHEVAGMELGALPSTIALDDLADVFADAYASDCELDDEESYRDPLYTGTMRTYRCPDDAEVVVVAAAPEDDAFHLGLAIDNTADAPVDLVQHILDTFQAVGDPLEAATG
jgi:serine/threonine-protein kinase